MKDHGGRVVIGNENIFTDRNLVPTVILNPDKNCALMKQEIFGPILPILTYKTVDEAIEYITEEQEKPLVVYFFGEKNGDNMQRFKNETSSGTFVCNELIKQVLSYDLPFGGVGHSGYGRSHGYAAFKEYSHMKPHLIKGVWNFMPFTIAFPPFDEAKKK